MAINKKTRDKISQFVSRWSGKHSEKSEADNFWEDMLENIFDVPQPYKFVEKQKDTTVEVFVETENGKQSTYRKKFIDIYVPSSGCVIEHKSSKVSLDKTVIQSDGNPYNARQQAKRYYDSLDRPEQGRYLIACNFNEFIIFDNDHKRNQEVRFNLEDLSKYYIPLKEALFYNLNKTKESEDRKEYESARTANEFVKKLQSLLLSQYSKAERGKELDHVLNVFCVRVVFCLYADDAGLFPEGALKHFLELYDKPDLLREKFKTLFVALNTKKELRHALLDDAIKVFDQVNGGLFGGETVEIPRMTEEVRVLLLNSVNTLYEPDSDSIPFHWSDISPTNFGCIFESTVSEKVRKNQGMHYTTVENIHRVIDPLFLNDLIDELDGIISLPHRNTLENVKRDEKLHSFINKIAKLKFLDPACGSGNFLTETFRSLRQLEHKALSEVTNKQNTICVVKISQFYGIEIDDFACQVARTALWIAWCQMETEAEMRYALTCKALPLDKNENIIEADALQTDWRKVVEPSKINYIIGNPPFMGSQGMKQAKVKDSFTNAMISLRDSDGKALWNKVGDMDYVCAWFAKAADYINGHSRIRVAFVSTNSITQGEQVAALWQPLVEKLNLKIIFAWKSFAWFNEATDSANVHCVIIAFCSQKSKLSFPCHIYEVNKETQECSSVNSYLLPAEQVFLKSSRKHIQREYAPLMRFGSMPNDTVKIKQEDGKQKEIPMLRLCKDEREKLIKEYPELQPYLPRIYGSEDFISNEENYCIWLDGEVPTNIIRHKAFCERFERLRKRREESTRPETRALARTPYLFGEIRQPQDTYLLIPKTSSENRNYVPMGYVDKSIICTDATFSVESCPLWCFGILTSSIHQAWIKVVAGRLEMRTRYSASVVYNNFPFPSEITEEQRADIENTAQRIIDARNSHPNDSLADLYGFPMQKDLMAAHVANDDAVFAAYAYLGIDKSMNAEQIAIILLKESAKLSKVKNSRKKRKKKATLKR